MGLILSVGLCFRKNICGYSLS